MQFSVPSVVAAATDAPITDAPTTDAVADAPTTDAPVTEAPSDPPVLAIATPVPTVSHSPTNHPTTAAPVTFHPTTAVCKAETNECGAGIPCADGSCCSQYGVSFYCFIHMFIYTHSEHC